jgi:hypothetical protein
MECHRYVFLLIILLVLLFYNMTFTIKIISQKISEGEVAEIKEQYFSGRKEEYIW